MLDLTRHFRGLGIALAVLTLSAGAVFAGQAALTAPDTSPVAAEETPDADETPGSEIPETEDPTADADEDAEDADDAASDTHGTAVSEAAQMDTPEGFENHGAFVSCVAKLNNGQWGGGEPAVPVVVADLTPEACDALAVEAAAAKTAAKTEKATERAAAKEARGAARAAAKEARAAAKAARGH